MRGLIILPVLVAIVSAYYKWLWLIPVVVFLMFVLVGLLPFCRKHENLWIFILTVLCSIPVNWLLLTEFDIWREFLYCGSGNILTKIVLVEYILVLTGVEEIVLGLITRFLWRKQYRLFIPVDKEE